MLQMYHFTSFSLNFKSNVLVKRALFLFKLAFAIAILDLISQVHISYILAYIEHNADVSLENFNAVRTLSFLLYNPYVHF